MAVDRYVKVVLTIIALELFWIGVKDVAPPVAAQAQPTPTPVVIRGIQLAPASNEYLPVGIIGQPLRVDLPRAVRIEGPIKIEADTPIKVENVGYTPAPKPGE